MIFGKFGCLSDGCWSHDSSCVAEAPSRLCSLVFILRDEEMSRVWIKGLEKGNVSF